MQMSGTLTWHLIYSRSKVIHWSDSMILNLRIIVLMTTFFWIEWNSPGEGNKSKLTAYSVQQRTSVTDQTLLLLLSHFSRATPETAAQQALTVPGILQARTLDWVAISFSNAWKWKGKVKSLSRVRLLATPWTAAHQAPPSMGFSRQEYWSGVPLPSPKLTL